MSNRNIIRILPAICLALIGTTIHAQASLSMQSNFSTAVYSPNGRIQSNAVLRVQDSGYSGTVTVILTLISFSPQPSAPAQAPAWGFYAPSASLANRLDTTGAPGAASQTITGILPYDKTKKTRVDLNFSLVVESSPLPAPGTYTVRVHADLYESAFPVSGHSKDSLTFNAYITVSNFCDLSLVPSGGAFSLASTSQSMAFGILEAGASRGIDFLVRSNAAYSLALSSQKGGMLANIDPLASDSAMPYVLRVDGQAIALQSGIPAPVIPGAAPTSLAGQRRAVAVTMLPWDFLPAEGIYTDYITITLSSP